MNFLLRIFITAFIITSLRHFQYAESRNIMPSICLQPPPRSEGVCTIEIEGFYYDSRTNDCHIYVIGGCRSSRGQSFGSISDCLATCVHGTRRIQDLRINE